MSKKVKADKSSLDSDSDAEVNYAVSLARLCLGKPSPNKIYEKENKQRKRNSIEIMAS